VSPQSPPLPFPDAGFDLAYLLSVFSHLPEATTLAWLTDLARVTRPGGIVIVTTHGVPCLETIIRSEPHRKMVGMAEGQGEQILRELPQRGYTYLSYPAAVRQAANVGIEYGNCFVDPDFARGLWRRHFEVLEHIPGGMDGWQDIFVLRAPGS
jgi:SAM-dependent methyltransferase